ncbi:MAG: hypothetical protein H6737_32110 [Alphaproteobacteria bacterium]|nr:hypothetical protein [Alphaproteobacteria bacterium]
MSETDDAHASLEDKKIAVRAAATRDLAKAGTYADVERLIGMAIGDKSPSVRLYAAAAAVAILMRGRGAYDQTPWTDAQRHDVLRWVGAGDPALTPSLLLCYAAFSDADVIQRLTRMLRDPRYGVRAGAIAAIRRMALSGAATREGTGLREWVGEALENRKLPPDVSVELVRLVGEAGWEVLLPRARKAPGNVGEALAEAEARCAERNTPAAWAGIWVDEGRDVLDESPAGRADWIVIGADAQPSGGTLARDGRVYRRIWAPRIADEGKHAAIQADGRTWWRMDGKALAQFVTDADHELVAHGEAVDAIAAMLEGVEGAGAVRARALLFARCGRADEALALLDPLLAQKKPRNDLYFLQALALRSKGDAKGARAALEAYLDKAKKTEPWRDEAEQLLDGL